MSSAYIRAFNSTSKASLWVSCCCDRCDKSFNVRNTWQCQVEQKMAAATYDAAMPEILLTEEEAKFVGMVNDQNNWVMPFEEPCSGFAWEK